MPNPQPGPSVVRFGDFVLDLRSGELASSGHRALLAEQPFRILALLIRERGQVVSRDVLRHELWAGDTFVDFELSLNTAMKRLRETLGDSATSPRFIQTLPRRGYRFIAHVEDMTLAPPAHAPAAYGAAAGREAESPSPGRVTSTNRRLVLWAAAGTAAMAVTAALVRSSGDSRVPPDAGTRTPRVSELTRDGAVRMASLSPDGSEFTYVSVDGTQESLWLGRADDSPPLRLVAPSDGTFRSVTFGPDGFIYYQFFKPDRTHVSLYRVSTRRGEPTLVYESAGNVSFSPDGRHFAYVSSYSLGRRESRVTVVDVGSGAERMLAVRTPPASFLRPKPAWSPDGRSLVVIGLDERRPLVRELVTIDAASGRVQSVAALGVDTIEEVLWTRHEMADRLLVSARERKVYPMRLWHVALATGERRPLTGDSGDYTLGGLTPDGRRVVAVRAETRWSLWVARAGMVSIPRQVAEGTGSFELLEGVAWTPGGQIVYADAASGNLDLWRLDPGSGERARLTFDVAEDYHPAVSPDGRTLVFASTRSGTSAIWATPIEANRPRQLTDGGDLWPSLSPDGRWVVFQRGMAATSVESAWRVAITGGDAERLGPSHVLRPVVSPDGRSIAHYWMNPDRWTLAVTPIGSELPTRTLPLSRTHGARVARWSPDGRALALVDSHEGAANIWLQPLDGSPARKLTDLADGTIETFDWSRDGSWLAWMQVRRTGDVVAVE